MILAKPVIANKYWILKENDRKVGEVEAHNGAFIVKINNDETEFKTIKTLKNRTNIHFEETPKKEKAKKAHEVNGFPTSGVPHNAVYNVQKRLPMYTKTKKSKSWFAAGYYQIEINGRWETHFCPKLIMLQRYPSRGPVKSADGFTFL